MSLFLLIAGGGGDRGGGVLKRMILDFLAEMWPFSKFLDFR